MSQVHPENKLKKIELEHPIETIAVNDTQVWPLVRFQYFIALTAIRHTKPKFNYWYSIKSMFYGWRSLFGTYKYLYFSDSMERKFLGEKWVDKSMDHIYATMKDGLLFELPLPQHKKKEDTLTEHVTSKLLLYAAASIYAFLFLRRLKIKNQEVLESINSLFKVNVDYVGIIKKNLAFYTIGKMLMKLYRPKAVFIQCSYTNFGLIKAFKDNRVPVIEIQHGIITHTHGAYNVYKKLDNNFFPDFLLTFGEREREIFTDVNYFIDARNVIPVGHFYIDYLNTHYSGDERLRRILTGYKKSVTVSSQDLEEEKDLIAFLKEAAKISTDTLFIFFPRFKPPVYYEQFGFPSNIIITPWLNVYEAIAQTDFHSTIYSTCAIEAPSLGVRNILVNINQLSVKHFGYLLTNIGLHFVANTPEEFVLYLNEPHISKREIQNANKYYIKPEYQSNVLEALPKIINPDVLKQLLLQDFPDS